MKVMVGYHIMNEVEVPEGEVKHALCIVRSISNASERSRVLSMLLNDIILRANPTIEDLFTEWDEEITTVYNRDFESNNLEEILWEG